jgi:hypothetical protein
MQSTITITNTRSNGDTNIPERMEVMALELDKKLADMRAAYAERQSIMQELKDTLHETSHNLLSYKNSLAKTNQTTAQIGWKARRLEAAMDSCTTLEEKKNLLTG